MKHYMQPRTAILRENDVVMHSNSPQKSKPRKHKGSKENATPSELNSASPAHPVSAKLKSPLPPRPPTSSSNPLKRKLSLEHAAESSAKGGSDSGVKVIVRMRPLTKEEEEGDLIVNKVSNDALSINGHAFTFDSVADIGATQQDIFQLIGAPLVENCLAGFNSSVFAYGQTGSGKTYTMWGPANALLEQQLSSDQQGLTPRVLERLFARINEEQIKHSDKQLKYQCRCSFLEIYNEQITDLLDPTQRNLQIREDVKSGVYVENLTEECVCSMKDVTQILIKGMSNRRTGATSINADSSRSHCVFTCIVESRYKNNAEGISSLRTSRINLVDLAGSERQKSTGAAGERLKEAGNINRSLSQLGNLINILADVSQTGKQRHIPYRDSRLTFLLQESLGGNAKLAMICAISPAQRCKSETFSTLRFAQRAKAIKNKAVVNEAMDDDVHVLRDIIRQLKDELLRMKSTAKNPAVTNGGYTPGFVRRSLHLLKYSLNRPMTLPHDDDDGDAVMEIDEDGVDEKLCNQVDKELIGQDSSIKGSCSEQTEDVDVEMDESEQFEKREVLKDETGHDKDFSEQLAENKVLDSSTSFLSEKLPNSINSVGNLPLVAEALESSSTNKLKSSLKRPIDDSEHVGLPCTVSMVMCDASPDLKSPTPSVSPRVTDNIKSLTSSTMLTAEQKACKNENKPGDAVHLSFLKTVENCSSSVSCNQKSKKVRATTEHLAASLYHGLEIIGNHCQRSPLRLSPFRSSYKPADKSLLPVEKADVGVQTFLQDDEALQKEVIVYLCNNCKTRSVTEVKENDDVLNMQLVPVDGDTAEKSMKQIPKAVEKVLAGSFRREMALEEFCAKQASELVQLNRLVQQYRHERECSAVIAQTREDKILRLESLMDGILPAEEFLEEELLSLRNEHKLLQETYENHPEVLRTKVELQKAQDQLENFRNFFDLGEKEVLIEEIHDLRSQLQYYIDSSSASAQKRSPLYHLTYPSEPSAIQALGTIPEVSTRDSAEDKFEQERSRWAETEGKWISFAEELKTELEAAQSLSEKRKQELDSEKRFAEELKEALQLAMQGHARMLEQYADLEEKHMQLLARHRRIQEGIDDVKRAASRAGVKGAESKFINALAAEISALKAEREKERRYFRDENKGLQAQLRDTAEAVQAAGELLVRLKEAEEAVAAAQKQAKEATKETEKLKQLLAESHAKEKRSEANCECTEAIIEYGQEWREDLKPLDDIDDKLGEPSSWFSGYDRCNI